MSANSLVTYNCKLIWRLSEPIWQKAIQVQCSYQNYLMVKLFFVQAFKIKPISYLIYQYLHWSGWLLCRNILILCNQVSQKLHYSEDICVQYISGRTKGQLILKRLFFIFNSPKKLTKILALLPWYLKSNCFCSFFERIEDTKKTFRN